MDFADAQRDMRYAYAGGAPGLVASAAAWFVAAGVARGVSNRAAVIALFAGGMLIHPVAVLIAKALGRPGAHDPRNPLGRLAMEVTFVLLLCLPVAVVISFYRMRLFFPAMLLVIGGRYFTFATLYGTRAYWMCGVILSAAGFVLASIAAPPALSAASGGFIELLFSAVIYAAVRNDPASPAREARTFP